VRSGKVGENQREKNGHRERDFAQRPIGWENDEGWSEKAFGKATSWTEGFGDAASARYYLGRRAIDKTSKKTLKKKEGEQQVERGPARPV